MAGFPQYPIQSQQPVNIGSGYADPNDACQVCQAGYEEVSQMWNEVQQSCNACQNQQNIQQQVSGSCSQCQQAQQTIQQTQQQINQMGGCSQCGQQMPMLTNGQQMGMQP